jgi:hypothetical protein
MLTRESIRQALRLVLMNAFQDEEPVITKLLKDLYRKCPTLFESVLPRSEQEDLRHSLLEDEEEDSITAIQPDSLHRSPTATGCLQAIYCRNVLQLPTRASDTKLMTPEFKSQLRAALGKEYSLPHIINFGTHAIQWCKKSGFISGYLSFLYKSQVTTVSSFLANILQAIGTQIHICSTRFCSLSLKRDWPNRWYIYLYYVFYTTPLF